MGDWMVPRRTASISKTSPPTVHRAKATTDDSTPNLPPVNRSGPDSTGDSKPGGIALPDTAPEKIPAYV